MTVRAAYNQGDIPAIYVINQAKTPLGMTLEKFVAVSQQWIDLAGKIWDVRCKIVAVRNADAVPKGGVKATLVDECPDPEAVAFHTVTGLRPDIIVGVKTALDAGDTALAAFLHEVLETLVDPGCQLAAECATGVFVALEPVDPCQGDMFTIDGVKVPNFVHPAWFESQHQPGSVQFDHMGLIKRPFQVRPDGYASVNVRGKWTNTFGSQRAAKRFAKRPHFRVARRLGGHHFARNEGASRGPRIPQLVARALRALDRLNPGPESECSTAAAADAAARAYCANAAGRRAKGPTRSQRAAKP